MAATVMTPVMRVGPVSATIAAKTGTFGLLSLGNAIDGFNRVARLSLEAGKHFTNIVALQSDSRTCLEHDRKSFLDALVVKAQVAAQTGDSRTQYAIARSLGAAKSSPNSEVFKKDGSLTTSPAEEVVRWQEHFCEVFQGRATTSE